MPSQSNRKEALQVLRLAVEFMQWKTFEGGRRDKSDAALPLKKDQMYHYDDGKIDIAYDVNTRSHRIDTYIRISVIRGRLLRKREMVFDAENNSVNTFRPGHWVDYVTGLAEGARAEKLQIEESEKSLQKAAARHAEAEREKKFMPIDDSAIFRK